MSYMTRNEKVEVSKHINSLIVWQTSLRDLCERNAKKRVENFADEHDKRVKWYNEAADALIAMGIDVVRYR